MFNQLSKKKKITNVAALSYLHADIAMVAIVDGSQVALYDFGASTGDLDLLNHPRTPFCLLRSKRSRGYAAFQLTSPSRKV